jgi:hypothetical protein
MALTLANPSTDASLATSRPSAGSRIAWRSKALGKKHFGEEDCCWDDATDEEEEEEEEEEGDDAWAAKPPPSMQYSCRVRRPTMTHTSEATPGMTSAARFIFAALGEPPRPAPFAGFRFTSFCTASHPALRRERGRGGGKRRGG